VYPAFWIAALIWDSTDFFRIVGEHALFRGEVDRGQRNAFQLADLLFDPRRAGGAGHAGDWDSHFLGGHFRCCLVTGFGDRFLDLIEAELAIIERDAELLSRQIDIGLAHTG